MLDELKLWLDGFVAPYKARMIIDAYKALKIQNGDVVEDALQRIIYSMKEMDDSTALTYIERDLVTYLINAIKVYGVDMNEDTIDTTHIDLLTNVLTALQQVEDYEDFFTLHSDLEMGGDDISIISEIIGDVANMDASLISYHIVRVNPKLLVGIASIVNKKMDVWNQEQEQAENEALLAKRSFTKQKRELLFGYLAKLSKGDEQVLANLKTIAGRFATYNKEDLFRKCFGFLSKGTLSVVQQANTWVLAYHLINFMDSEDFEEGQQTPDRLKEMKDYLAQCYDDPNFLLTLNIRIDEALALNG